MENELEPLICCWSGCLDLADDHGGWWGSVCYCYKHNKEMTDMYIEDCKAGRISEVLDPFDLDDL